MVDCARGKELNFLAYNTPRPPIRIIYIYMNVLFYYKDTNQDVTLIHV